ncbi:hypothetical protein F8M41_020882 [Gigaspora margarita]|uniref:Uncharacterized protein n=1 Tax=Gigaspora margarita TaxID=4874 RepID=A0A8H4AHS0_GIGMA|nr:hypothetical protein F8M41_020882 [Gigaspora margarita]
MISQQQPDLADQDLPIARMHKDSIIQTSKLPFLMTHAPELTWLPNQNSNTPDPMDLNPTQSMVIDQENRNHTDPTILSSEPSELTTTTPDPCDLLIKLIKYLDRT